MDNEAIAVATQHPDAFIDTSACTPDRYLPQLAEFIGHHGGRDVLFGGKYAMISPAKALAGLYALWLDDTLRQQFLEDKAKRRLGFHDRALAR